MIKLINGDCLEALKNIEDKSVNLILIDPPYNIKKAKWDSWKTTEAYVEFMGKVFKELERVLKDNGSFYFFHNDFLQVVELQNYINKNTNFKFKNLLIWNKRYEGSPKKYYFDNVIKGSTNRSYRQLTEYVLFYTLQSETNLVRQMRKWDLPMFKGLREYSEKIQKEIGLNIKRINERLGHRGAEHFFYQNSMQWELLTEKTYNQIIKEFKIDKLDFFKPYNELLKEYKIQREEYEKKLYTFNNLKEHHDVLTFEVAKQNGHITPKPVDLLEYIIKTSSNEGDIVLDCFAGSGSTGVACANTNRRFIGIELDKNYFEIAKKRIEEAKNEVN